MTCREINDQLEAYHDGECSESVRHEIDAHLGTCTACRTQLENWTRLVSHVFTSTPAQAPAFLWTRVRAGIEAEEALRGAPWWLEWRWMTRVTAVTTLLVGMGSYLLYQQAPLPLEVALQGRSPQQRAIQVATSAGAPDNDGASLVLEGDTWAAN